MIVRLEVRVTDEARARELAEHLVQVYAYPGDQPPPWDAATVELITDEDGRRDRAILTAAQYFLPSRLRGCSRA